MHDIKQQSIKKPELSLSQKVLYISKINIAFKPLTNAYFVDEKQKYNFSLSTLPPCDITAE